MLTSIQQASALGAKEAVMAITLKCDCSEFAWLWWIIAMLGVRKS